MQSRRVYEKDRLRLLVDQPGQLPNFTVNGFEVTRAPPLLLEAVQNFFQLTKANYSREVRFEHATASRHRKYFRISIIEPDNWVPSHLYNLTLQILVHVVGSDPPQRYTIQYVSTFTMQVVAQATIWDGPHTNVHRLIAAHVQECTTDSPDDP